jgi:predicted amidohydrolase YtcJ
MKGSRLQRRFSRRQFTIALGTLAGWFATACARRGNTALPSPAPTVSRATAINVPTAALPSQRSPTPLGATSTAVRPTSTAVASAVANPTVMAVTGIPETIYVNGKVVTVDAKDSIAQAVAVKGGVIQAVGRTLEIRAMAGLQTKVVDLKGKTMTPGIIDAHNHMQVYGMCQGYYASMMPPEVRTMADLTTKVKDLARITPKGEWIKGYFFAVGDGMPTRADLDPVSPDHPVFLYQQGGHLASVNSLALKAAKITSATKSPEGGYIEKDARGEPTGVFYNHRALDLVRQVMPSTGVEDARQWIATGLSYFASVGVTTYHDNNVRDLDTIRTYLDMGRHGQSPLRSIIYYTLEWPNDLQRALNEVERYQDARTRMAGFKFLIDGQSMTSYCHQPHNGVKWNLTTWEPNSFKSAIRALHDTGLQIAVHCIGDAAVDLTLDAYEEAMNANPRPDPRHRIEHAVLTTKDATKRMKDLGIVVCTQPAFITVAGGYWDTIWGTERSNRVMVLREWLDAGVHTVVSSDSPTVPYYTPQTTFAASINRAVATTRPYHPEHTLTIQEALRAHTYEAAYAAHEERVKGSIEPGKLADLTVWNQDLLSISWQQLASATVAMTIVGGETVYPA